MLKDKLILLISPQPWGKLHLSKHHYAIELAEMGNKVFFLSPPGSSNGGISIQRLSENIELYEITHTLNFSSAIRFKMRWLFDMLMRRHVKRILSQIGVSVDIVWCFDPNIYSNLNWFNSRLKIFHPVDPITRKDQIIPAKSADILFSVSEKILSAFSSVLIPKYFVNHGLSDSFAMKAQNNLKELNDNIILNKTIKAGYVGNLLRPIIDRGVIRAIVRNNSNMLFYFWGPCEANESNVSGASDQSTKDFIEFLRTSENVKLLGPKSPEILACEIQEMDLFFFTYKLVDGQSDRSNSHKILEYLSTGKPVFSCPVDTYIKMNLLLPIEVLEKKMDIGILLNQLEKPRRMERIEYCLNNTYKKQIEKINAILLTVTDS